MAFGSFVFDPENTAGQSVLVVPQVVIGRRNGRSWLTWIGADAPERRRSCPARRAARGRAFLAGWPRRGGLAGRRGRGRPPDRPGRRGQGGARPRRGRRGRRTTSTRAGWPAGWPRRYPQCWTFLVDGLVGASPEMLVKREAGLALSRVLAGTIRRTGDDDRDLNLAAGWPSPARTCRSTSTPWPRSPGRWRPSARAMNVPEAPYILGLPNVLHLATDVTGVAEPAASALALAAALHPSAAVCGTPTDRGPGGDRRARAPGPGAVRRAGRLAGRGGQRRVGHRPALRADQRGRPAADPAVRRLRHRRRAPTRRQSWPSRWPSWCRCATPSSVDRVVAVVLAGGESRRFGSDKLAAAVDQQTLLDHTLAALPDAFTRDRRRTRRVRPGDGHVHPGAAAGWRSGRGAGRRSPRWL